MKILITDDDMVSNRVLARQLEDWQHEVTTVSNGFEALEAYEKETFGVIITDWMMPGMSGPELCAAIRNKERAGGPRTFIVLLTSRNSNEDLALAITAGANDFETKPFSPLVLKARLANAESMLRLQTMLHRKEAEL
ncbi:MAG: sigma-B regulation protein RsbU (phosphoserine phosphatase), partial [Myxococcota bacterium]